jgi:putative heme-binding domain-containing protein
MRFALSAFLALAVGQVSFAQDPSLVAPTNALTPAEEQKKLIVPDGFEVQLVASEPDIQKPMQMAFDAKGRIWVTTSYHYPFAAPAGKATDKLFILSDFDAKGKATKVQTFAADLNIPIGILPLPDCKSCIVSSVGEILKLTDTNDDGKYDKKEVLFSGFGSRDTHGMYNSFTLMPDGWVYACHGFNNDSKTKGKDGHEVAMRSGNTFRFKPDGSRVEAFTRGQVNPFGLCVDPWFNFYTADCHSKPITNLIPGATYESFNSTSDPLGFGPVMFGYDPGGTGLCGLAWYDADHFPAKYKGHLFLGNVVTNRVNMCKVEWTGATPKAVQQPDLIRSTDPWFRPVDIKLGPDGAVYVNDFYNKIIGHYEVDLKHPGRDKDRGRIWRVVNVKDTGSPKSPRTDWTAATDDDLTNDLAHPNLTVRFLAGNQLMTRARAGKMPKEDGGSLLKLLQDPKTASGVAGWFSFASEATGMSPNYRELVEQSKNLKIAPDGHTTLVLRAMSNREKWEDAERKLALEILKIDAPKLTRATVEAMAIHPHADFVKPLIELLGKVLPGDDHMRHAVRIALKNSLRSAEAGDDAWKWAYSSQPELGRQLLEIVLAIPTETAAKNLGEDILRDRVPAERLSAAADHIGRHGGYKEWEAVLKRLRPEKNGARVIEVLTSLVRGAQSNKEKDRQIETFVSSMTDRAYDELTGGTREVKVAAIRFLADLGGIAADGPRRIVVSKTKPVLIALVGNHPEPADLRSAALETLTKLDPKDGLATAEKLIDTFDTPPGLRERAALILAASTDRNHKQAAKDAIATVPYRSGVAIAIALASNSVGGEVLFDGVKQGKASARLLQEKLVLERLRAANIPNLDKQLADLTKGLPPADQKLAELIKQRTVKFTSAKLDKEAGLKLFTKHCAACHKIGEAGGKVGPNLDGVGLRGLERLLEDTLDPNRNVDAAFRARVLNLVDGTTKTGLMLRVEGEVLVMADDQGKEFRVPTKDIEKNRETALSPMPANFGEVIPEAEFYQLLGYLMDQKTKELPKKE